MNLRILLAAIAVIFGISACGEEPTTPAKTTATVEISGLYFVKPAEGRDQTGGGMTITATGGDFRLISASSEAAERVELHTMTMEDDMMRMRQVEGYDIPAGESFVLEPGGPHMMLFGVDPDIQVGETAEMLFTFRDSNDAEITLNYEAEIKAMGHH